MALKNTAAAITLPALCTGVALAASFSIPYLAGLAFVAFIPLLAILPQLNLLTAYLCGFIVGLAAFSLGNYWLFSFFYNLTESLPVTVVFFVVYCTYSAQGFALLAFGVRTLQMHCGKLGALLSIPFFMVALLEAFPFLFNVSLAATQVAAPGLLTPIAITGHWGLSWLIALINLILAQLLYSHNHQACSARPVLVGVGLSCVGLWMVATLLPWRTPAIGDGVTLRVGFHQPNDLADSQTLTPLPPHTLGYPPEFAANQKLKAANPDVIIWPEARAKGILKFAWVAQAYARHAQTNNFHMILQDTGSYRFEAAPNYNSSLHFTPTGQMHRYDKINTIPFGEYMPAWVKYLPARETIARLFSPINKNLTAGTDVRLFNVEEIHILPLICYEIIDSLFVTNALNTQRSADWVILQSNDAWFFSEAQARMHNAHAILRAIELQRPILHITNQGPSYAIDHRGKVSFSTRYREPGSFVWTLSLPTGHPPDGLAVKLPGWFLYLAVAVSLCALSVGLLRAARAQYSHHRA